MPLSREHGEKYHIGGVPFSDVISGLGGRRTGLTRLTVDVCTENDHESHTLGTTPRKISIPRTRRSYLSLTPLSCESTVEQKHHGNNQYSWSYHQEDSVGLCRSDTTCSFPFDESYSCRMHLSAGCRAMSRSRTESTATTTTTKTKTTIVCGGRIHDRSRRDSHQLLF